MTTNRPNTSMAFALFCMAVLFNAFRSTNGNTRCKDLVYLPCIKNKNFTGHVIKTIRLMAPGLEECQSKCFNEKYCISYNLGPVTHQTLTCELNDLDHVTHQNDVITQEGAHYCPIKNPCSSNPCSADKNCMPDFNAGTFACSEGIWSKWGPWCRCLGTRSRVRNCRVPLTNKAVNDCPGPRIQSNDVVTYGKDPTSCYDASRNCGCSKSGVYTFGKEKFFCDQETAGGGWTVIQRRQDGSQTFNLGWQDYKVGFGKLTGEFWLGLDTMHKLTSGNCKYRLRVDLDNAAHAEYNFFKVNDERDKYRLILGNFVEGNAKDSLLSHNNQRFSTKDRDNDAWFYSCANRYKNGWWFQDCHTSNLNGIYYPSGYNTERNYGIIWSSWRGFGYSIRKTEMKIRPIDVCQ